MSWDAIVIGSGIGGLTAAVALARAGQRVLVLEQHYLPGGWTQSFTLDGYSFSPGVHYIGGLGPDGHLRRLFEGLGVAKHMAFSEMSPDGYDHLLIAGERIDVPKGRERWQARLVERFPQQRAAINSYFAIALAVTSELQRVDECLGFPRVLTLPFRAPNLTRWGLRSLEALFDHCGIRDPLLRGALSARAGNHGLAPSRVSLPLHLSMIDHYYNGAFYPRGGARKITSAFIKELRSHGGQIELRTRVRQILVENGAAVGVEVEGGERIVGKRVISNADAALTYEKLLPPPHGRRQRRRARGMVQSVSCLSLFAATDIDLATRGYDSGNYWWYRDTDVNGLYERMERSLPSGELDGLFLAVSSLKDPAARRHGHHTLEMFTFVPYQPFARFAGTDPDSRQPDYLALKAALTEKMVTAAEHIIPGLRRRITFCELGTPVTNQFYCEARRGSCYGTAKTPWQVGPFSFSTDGPVRNLHLAGASTVSHGIGGATMSGLFAAQTILGLERPGDCLSAPDGSLRVTPAGPGGQGRVRPLGGVAHRAAALAGDDRPSSWRDSAE